MTDLNLHPEYLSFITVLFYDKCLITPTVSHCIELNVNGLLSLDMLIHSH